MALGELEGKGMAGDGEKSTSATGHGCVDGSLLIERVLDAGKLWMEREDASLKVVGQLMAPGGDRLPDDVAAALGRLLGCDEREGVASGDGDGRFDDDEVVGTEVDADGCELLADALCIGWLRLDEEGAVGSECGSKGDKLLRGELELEKAVEQREGVGSVA